MNALKIPGRPQNRSKVVASTNDCVLDGPLRVQLLTKGFHVDLQCLLLPRCCDKDEPVMMADLLTALRAAVNVSRYSSKIM